MSVSHTFCPSGQRNRPERRRQTDNQGEVVAGTGDGDESPRTPAFLHSSILFFVHGVHDGTPVFPVHFFCTALFSTSG